MSARPRKPLEWSRRCAQDLLDIEDYIARDNQTAANAVVAQIKQRALLLETDPLLGKRRLISSHRELILTRFPFTIVYRVTRGNVVISRILRQRRQFP